MGKKKKKKKEKTRTPAEKNLMKGQYGFGEE